MNDGIICVTRNAISSADLLRNSNRARTYAESVEMAVATAPATVDTTRLFTRYVPKSALPNRPW